MQNNTVETIIGAIVVAVAALFLFYAYTSTGSGRVAGYDLYARFAAADGITNGTDVRLHGIKVGTVTSLALDPKTYQAIVHVSVRDDIKIPDDSTIKVTSSGVLGGNYVSISPGGSDKMLAAGGEIPNTQGSVDLFGLISKTINSK